MFSGDLSRLLVSDRSSTHSLSSLQLGVSLFLYRRWSQQTSCSDVREHHSETITRFVWGLRSKIRRAMITDSYDLDIVEEAFDVALNINLTFKTLVNAKVRCSKCKWYEHYDYQCPSESQHVRNVLSDEVDDSKVVENVHISSKTVSIIKRHISWFRHTDYWGGSCFLWEY